LITQTTNFGLTTVVRIYPTFWGKWC